MGGSGNSSSEDDEDDDIRPPPPVRKLVRKPSPIKRPKIKRRKIKQSKPSYTWTPFDHDSDEDFQSKPPDIGLVANKSGPKQHTSRKNSNSSSSSSSSNKNNNNSGKLKSKASNSRSSSSSSRDLIDDSSSNDVIMRTEDEYSDSSNSKSSITRVLRKRFTDINVETDSSLSELESDDSNSTNTTNNKTHHRHFKQFAQTHSANKKEIFQPPESTSSTLLENNVSLKGKRAFKIPEIPKPRKKPSKTTSPAAAATTTTKTVSKICQHCQEPGHVDKYDKKCKLHKKKEGKSPLRGKWQRSSSDSSITTSADESSDSSSSSSSSSSVGRGKSVKRCCINYGKDHKSRTSDKCLNYRPPIKTKLIKRYFHNYNVDCELKSVKMSFATICHNEEIRKQVYNDVREVSAFKVAFSYWFEFLLRHKNTPVLDDLKASDNEPDFYILYSQYLKEKNLAKTCDAKVGKIFEEFQKLHPSDNDYKYNGHGKTNIMKQAIAQWTENFQQNVEKHAKDRLKKYFKSIKNKDHERRYDDKEIDDIVEKLLINNVIPEDDLFKNYTHLDFTNLRIKRKWWKFVGFFKEMQKFIKFKLSPICKHGLHHMLYDTSAVHQLLMRLPGKIVGSNYEIETVGAVAVDLQPDPEPYKFLKMWGLFVKIPSKHKNFGCSLSTDGVAVTIHCLRKMKETIEVDSDDELFDDEIEYEADDEDDDDDDDDDDGEKKKKEDKKDSTPDDGEITVRYMIQKIEERYDRLVGLDPGLKEIFAGIILELLRNYSNKEFQERFKLKSATYHHKTHHCQRDIKRRKWTQNYEKTFKQQLKQYRQENDQFKVDNPTDYENITRYRLQLFEAGQPDYSQKKVARLKLDKYINTQIVNEIIANYIVSGEYMSSKKELRLKRQKEKRKQEREERRKEKRERDKQRIFEKNQRKKERREEKKRNKAPDTDTTTAAAATPPSPPPPKKIRAKTRQKKKDERKFKGDKKAIEAAAERFAEKVKERRKLKRKRMLQRRKIKNEAKKQLNNIAPAAPAAAAALPAAAANISTNTDELGNVKKKKRKRKKSIKVKKKTGKTLVVIGETNISQWMKGYRRVSLNGIKSIIRHRAKRPESNIKLIVTDEYKTTKICSHCLSDCEKSKSPHRYLICTNEACRVTWNRDINAGRNILILGLIRDGLLPAEFMDHVTSKFRTSKQTRGLVPAMDPRTTMSSEGGNAQGVQ